MTPRHGVSAVANGSNPKYCWDLGEVARIRIPERRTGPMAKSKASLTAAGLALSALWGPRRKRK
jgi:hypothetical protein